VRRLAAELPLPLVIDADGLNHLGAEAAACLKPAPAPGCSPRTRGDGSAAGRGHRVGAVRSPGAARRLARDSGALVVLKGARTVIARPDGSLSLNPAADPALGTAGSGDVLTGAITGLLAQRLPAADAVRVAVFAHGEAAADARRALGTGHLIAGDLPEAIARVLERLSPGPGSPPSS
jgi:NAD(P)H-hydrate epimerase